jgi:hypothetical protein
MPEPPTPYVLRLRAARGLAVLGAMAFLAALALPAYSTYYGPTIGIEALAFGPLGVLGGHVSWFANIFILMFWKNCSPTTRTRALIYALVSLGVAGSFLIPQEIPQGSAGSYSYVAGIGYFAWLTSIALFNLAAVVLPSESTPSIGDEMPNKSLERTREG